jgi:hypothetical protein
MPTAKVIDFNSPEAVASVGSDLADTSMSLAQRLRVCIVTDSDSLQQAVDDRQSIASALTTIENYFGPLIAMAHKLHKALCDRRSEISEPLKRVDAMKRAAISEYKDAEDRRRQQQEREESERQRREEHDRATAAAASLEQSGEHALAQSVIAEAIAAPMPVVVLPDTTKSVDGLKFRRRYLWRFAGGPKDVKQTPPATVARTMAIIPRDFLTLDDIKLGAYARAMKGSATVPGIEFFHVDDPVR